MKENIIIRLERENEYHEVENLVRESFWNVYRPGCLEHYVLHQLRNDPAFVPELDFVMGEDTNRQVDFLIKQLHLKGTKKILDLACGFGRHSLEFARRGYDVTGIDITPAYIDYANEQAKKENLNAKFICQDIRTITFDKEFDVVLNMADGAIGYLEDDGENHKIFSVIAKALKNGGKHFMDIMNGSYAQTHFPCKLWDAGEKGLTLSAFEWEKDRKTLIYGQVDYMYGEALYKPEMKEGNPIRLYSLDEITEIFCKLGLRICNSFADFSGKPSSDNDIQLMVYSIRE